MRVTIELAEEIPAQEDRGWGPVDPLYDAPAAKVRRLMDATGMSAEEAVLELLGIALTYGVCYLQRGEEALRSRWTVESPWQE